VNRGPVTPRVRGSAVVTVLTVAAVAAVMSYGHLRAVADEQGESAAALFPLSVDGLIVAASLVLLVRRRSGEPGGVLAWSGLLVGITATVAGNVASAEPTLAARLVAAWPPVAFALSYELLLALIRPSNEAGRPHDPASTPEREDEARPAPTPGATATAGGGLEERARELLDAAGPRPPGRRALARELGVSEHQARTVLAAVSRNGTSTRRTWNSAAGEEPH
jgi:pyruvate/2-oxoglutarate dehydrogenase complex dihydrolipoamide acyltransferase (E2) component